MNCLLAEFKLHESMGFVGSRYIRNLEEYMVHKYLLGEYSLLFPLTVLMTLLSVPELDQVLYVVFIHVHKILQCEVK